MPEWNEDALILSVRPHGKSSAVVSVLTVGQGRHAGLVRGGNSSGFAARSSLAILSRPHGVRDFPNS